MRTEFGSSPTCHSRPSRFLRLVTGLAVSLLLISCRQDSAPGMDIAGAVLVPSATAVAGIELFAGALGGSGNVDGTGTAARFNNPAGMAVADDGTIYLADSANHVIRKITPAGVVTIFAGKAGVPGADNAPVPTDARFRRPTGLALASDGTLYVADIESNTIRRITPAGVVDTLAGADGMADYKDDVIGTSARFHAPYALAVSPDNDIYVSDTANAVIRKITPDGVVTTFAGTAYVKGSGNGVGTAASFNLPVGLAFDSEKNLIVADAGSHMIRKITTPGGVVSTIAGSTTAGKQDGTGTAASFREPVGIAVDSADVIYVADSGNNTLRTITAGVVATLAGTAGEVGDDDGFKEAARFRLPTSIGVDGADNIFVSDTNNHLVRQVTAGQVSTFAGATRKTGTDEGVGAAARFFSPSSLVLRSDGKLLVADAFNHALRMITPTATVSTFAGAAGVFGAVDGTVMEARFQVPQGIAIDGSGVVYVADSFNHVIRKIAVDGTVTTLAGQTGVSGRADGAGSQARFAFPWGVAVDLDGALYVADAGNHAIRKITPAGVVTTLAGSLGSFGFDDGTGAAAKFRTPRGIALGPDGNLYVADSENHTIRQITTAGVVTTLVGDAGKAGFADDVGSAARFDSPEAVAIDASGNLYVADTNNGTIRKVTPAKVATTVVGTVGQRGVAPGTLPGALNAPLGIAIGLDGEFYVSDEDGILRINLDTPLSVFNVRLAASTTAAVVGSPFTLRWAATDATGCMASGGTAGDGWAGSKGSSGSLEIIPTAEGSLSYTLTCNENGGAGLPQERTVTVNVTLPTPVVTLTASATRIDPGASATLTWSATHAASCTASGGTTGDGWAGSRGSSGTNTYTFTPTASATYTLSCTGSGGTTVKSVPVTVAYAPTLTFTAQPRKLVLGESTTLTWASAHVTTCTASGSWTGPQASSGSLVIKPGNSVAQVYTLSCSGPGGAVQEAVAVEVSFATSTAGNGGGSGGAAGLDLLLGAGALAMLRRLLGARRATI